MNRNAVLACAALFAAACSTQSGPVPCADDSNCPSGQFCNTSSGICAATVGSVTVAIGTIKPVTVLKTEQLTATAQGGVSWTVSSANGGSVGASSGLYTAPATPGSYTVVATSTVDSSASAMAQVQVVAAPTAPVIIANTTATRNATGLTASLSASSVQSGDSYAWTISGSGMITNTAAGGTSITFSAGSDASVMLSCVATNAAGDAAAAATFTITLLDATIAISGPQYATVGKGDYAASVAADPGATYLWTIDSGETITSGQGTDSIVFSVGGSEGMFNLGVKVTDAGGAVLTGALVVQAVAAVQTPILAGDLLVKAGHSDTVSVSNVQAEGVVYGWTISNGTFANSQTTTSGATVTYTAGAAGAIQLDCTATSLSGDTASATPFAVTSVGTASLSTSMLRANPLSAPADGTTSIHLTASIEDANSVPVFSEQVTFSVSPATGVSPQSQMVNTDANGSASFDFTSTKAEGKTVSAAIDGITLTKSVSFLSQAPVLSGSSLMVSTGATVADNTSVKTITAHLADGSGNPSGGYSVVFTASGSPASTDVFGNANCTSQADGTCTTTLATTVAETKTITATVSGTGVTTFALTGPATFIAGDPDLNKSIFGGTNNIVADNSSTSTLTLTLKDAFGNLVPNLTGIQVTATGSNNTLDIGTSTNANGVLTGTLASKTAEQKTITAKIPQPIAGTNFNDPTTVTFIAGAPLKASSSFTASNPAGLVANGTATSALAATILDQFNNPVSGISVAFSSSGSGNTLAPNAGAETTDSTGVANGTLASTVAQTKTITAQVSQGATALFTLPTQTVTFAPGDADGVQSKLTLSPSTSVVADNSSTVTISVLAKDGQGNLLTNLAGVSITATGSNNVFTPAGTGNTVTGTTDAITGIFSVTLATQTAEGKTITASIPHTVASGATALGPQTATFIAGAAVAGKSTFAAPNPTSAVASGAATIALSATLEDQFGNLVSGDTVTFTPGGTSNTLVPASGVATSVAGVASATIASTLVQSETITAVVKNGASTLFTFSTIPSISFFAGDADPTRSTLMVSPTTTITADNSSKATLTLTAKDAQGNLLKGLAGVTIASDGSGNTFSPAATNNIVTGTTDAVTGAFQVTLETTKAQLKHISATIPHTQTSGSTVPNTSPLSVTFVAGPAVGAALVVSGTPIVANGTATSPISVTLQDQFANPISGASVQFFASGSGNTLTPSTVQASNASGVASATLASTYAETKTISATISNPSVTVANTTVTFIPGDADAAQSSLTVSPLTSIPTDGASVATITLTAKDAKGNLITGLSGVDIEASGANNTFTIVSSSAKSTSSTFCDGFAAVTGTGTVNVQTYTYGQTLASEHCSTSVSALADGNTVSTVAGVFDLDTGDNGLGNPQPAILVTNCSDLGFSGYTPTSSTITPPNGALTVAAAYGSATPNLTVYGVVTAVSPWTAGTSSGSLYIEDATPGSSQPAVHSGTQIFVSKAAAATAGTPPAVGAVIAFSGLSWFVFEGVNEFEASSTSTVTALGTQPLPNAVAITATQASQAAYLSSSGYQGMRVTVTPAPFSVSGSLPSGTCPAQLEHDSTVSGTTDSNGTFQVTLSSTTPQTETLLGVIPHTQTSGFTTPASKQVTFVTGPPSTLTSTLTATPTTGSTVNGDGQQTYSLALTARDASGNGISAPVTYSASGVHTVFSMPATTTATGGAQGTVVSYATQTETLTALVAGVSISTSALAFAAPPWQPANSSQFGGTYESLAQDPLTGDLVIASSLTGVFRSTNSGASWTPTSTGIEGVSITALAASPQNISLLFAAGTATSMSTNSEIFKSTDGGATWQLVGSTPTNVFADQLFVSPLNNNQTLLSGSAYSTNGGATWTSTDIGPAASIAYDSNAGLYWMAGPGLGGGAYSSPNGISWTLVQLPVNAGSGGPCPASAAVAIDTSTNPSSVYIACLYAPAEVYKTNDNGHTFTSIAPSANGNSQVRSLAYNPSTKVIYAGTSDDGLFQLASGASSFTTLFSDGAYLDQSIVRILPGASAVFLSVAAIGFSEYTSGNILTENSGLLGASIIALLTDPVTTSNVYAVQSTNTFWKSTNSGASWTQMIGPPLVSGLTTLTSIDIDGRGDLYAMLYNSSTQANPIYELAAGGTSWNALPTAAPDSAGNYELLVDQHTPNLIYVLGASGLWRNTQNGVAPWTELPVPSWGTPEPAFASNSSILFAISLSSETPDVYRSIDEGNTWTQVLTLAQFTTAVGDGNLNSFGVNVSQYNPDWVVVSAADLTANPPTAWLAYTTNGTSTTPTWTFKSLGSGSVQIGFFDPYNSSVLFSAEINYPDNFTVTGLLRSLNGGTTWAPYASGLFGALPQASASFGPQGVIYVGTDRAGVYKSTTAEQ